MELHFGCVLCLLVVTFTLHYAIFHGTSSIFCLPDAASICVYGGCSRIFCIEIRLEVLLDKSFSSREEVERRNIFLTSLVVIILWEFRLSALVRWINIYDCVIIHWLVCVSLIFTHFFLVYVRMNRLLLNLAYRLASLVHYFLSISSDELILFMYLACWILSLSVAKLLLTLSPGYMILSMKWRLYVMYVWHGVIFNRSIKSWYRMVIIIIYSCLLAININLTTKLGI